MSWHPFFRIDNGFAKGRSSVTAVARNPDHLDLFVPETLVTLETGSNLCALYSHVRWTTRRMLEPSSTLSANASRSIPASWVTVHTGDIGNTFGPNGLAMESSLHVTSSKYPRS